MCLRCCAWADKLTRSWIFLQTMTLYKNRSNKLVNKRGGSKRELRDKKTLKRKQKKLDRPRGTIWPAPKVQENRRAWDSLLVNKSLWPFSKVVTFWFEGFALVGFLPWGFGARRWCFALACEPPCMFVFRIFFSTWRHGLSLFRSFYFCFLLLERM